MKGSKRGEERHSEAGPRDATEEQDTGRRCAPPRRAAAVGGLAKNDPSAWITGLTPNKDSVRVATLGVLLVGARAQRDRLALQSGLRLQWRGALLRGL